MRKLPVDIQIFQTGVSFSIGPFNVHPFPISHDAADPVGYTVQTDWSKVGIVTDLGCLTPSLFALKDCDLLILESNYDPGLLEIGPYPPHLKRRVASNHGHLSNPDAMTLLADLLHPKLKYLFLAHLSQKNNLPHLARQLAEETLTRKEAAVHLYLGWQDYISPVISLS